jgi:hypothetical protein
MTGERATRGHRSSQDALDQFNTIAPVRVDGQGKLYVQKLRGLPTVRGDESPEQVRAMLGALIRELRDRGYAE